MKSFTLRLSTVFIAAALSFSSCHVADLDDDQGIDQAANDPDPDHLFASLPIDSASIHYETALTEQREYQRTYNKIRADYITGKASEQLLESAESALVYAKIKSQALYHKVGTKAN